MKKLWQILKETLLEKSNDGKIDAMGSMKRLGGLLCILCVVAIVLVCLQPSFSLNLWVFHFSFNHNDYKIGDYVTTISLLLGAFATYLGIGEGSAVLKNYHNQKYGSDDTATTPANPPA